MANADAQMHMVTQEPRFHGRAEAKKGVGLSAEDFIARIQAFKDGGNWAANVTAVKAASWLRDSAHEWFAETLHLGDRALYDAMRADWDIFKSTFRKQFFSISITTDVSMEWYKLRQLEDETAKDFVSRVVAVFNKYGRLMEGDEMTPEQMRPMQTIVAGVADRPWGNLDQQVRDAVNAALLTSWNWIRDHTRTKILLDQAFNVAAAGMRHPKVRDAMLKAIREKLNLMDTLQQVGDVEKALDARKDPVPNRRFNSSGKDTDRAAVAATGADDGEDETQDPTLVDSINQAKKNNANGRGGRGGARGARGGRGRGGGNARGAAQQGPQQPRPMPGAYDTRGQERQDRNNTCFNCHQTGHWRAECPNPKVLASVPTLAASSPFYPVGSLAAGNEWA